MFQDIRQFVSLVTIAEKNLFAPVSPAVRPPYNAHHNMQQKRIGIPLGDIVIVWLAACDVLLHLCISMCRAKRPITTTAASSTLDRVVSSGTGVMFTLVIPQTNLCVRADVSL